MTNDSTEPTEHESDAAEALRDLLKGERERLDVDSDEDFAKLTRIATLLGEDAPVRPARIVDADGARVEPEVGDYYESAPGPDYDHGQVMAIDDGMVDIAWEHGACRTVQSVAALDGGLLYTDRPDSWRGER